MNRISINNQIKKIRIELQKEFSQYSKTWLKNRIISLEQQLRATATS
jgi:hypothetical protein